jgi:hypothetical protein
LPGEQLAVQPNPSRLTHLFAQTPQAS